MKKWFLIIGLILFFVSLLLYWHFNYPGNETVKREFLDQNPNVEFISAEKIFDWEPEKMETYLLKFKKPPSDEVLKDEFSIKQHWYF